MTDGLSGISLIRWYWPHRCSSGVTLKLDGGGREGRKGRGEGRERGKTTEGEDEEEGGRGVEGRVGKGDEGGRRKEKEGGGGREEGREEKRVEREVRMKERKGTAWKGKNAQLENFPLSE